MDTKHSLIILLSLTVVASGCLADVEGLDKEIDPDTEEVDINQTAGELLNSSIENFHDTEAHSIESENQMILSTSFFGFSITAESAGSFDRNLQLGEVETTGSVEAEFAGASNSTDFERTSEISENHTSATTSLEQDRSENTSKLGFKDNPFTNLDSVKDSEPELLGSEEINELDTYVLLLNPDEEKIGEHFSKILELYMDDPESSETESEEELEEEEFDNFNTYIWVDQETEKPVRFAYQSEMDVDNEGRGFLSRLTAVFGMYSKTDFTDYNEDTDFQS